MPIETYDLLDSVTLASSAASVTFSAIDQSYGDLILACEGLSSGGTGYLKMQINGDTSTNYYGVNMRTNGANAYSRVDTRSDFLFGVGNVYWDTVNLCQNFIQIQDYSATDKHKCILGRTDSAALGTCAEAMRWGSTAAITSLEISVNLWSIEAGSTFHLYGIAKAL